MSEDARPGELTVRVEDDRVSRGPLVATAAVACLVGVVAVLVSSAILAAGTSKSLPSRPPRASPQIGLVEQTLLADAKRGLDEKARQRRSLDRLEWIDRSRGLARIPIDDAMTLVSDPAFLRKVEARSRGGARGAGP
jgi:hypothetical protein